jgi:hypothetical protein
VARSNQAECVVFDYLSEVWAAEVDRNRLVDYSILHLSAKLLVHRLIFVSDVHFFKATSGASVLLLLANN